MSEKIDACRADERQDGTRCAGRRRDLGAGLLRGLDAGQVAKNVMVGIDRQGYGNAYCLAGVGAAEALQPADSWDRYPIAEDVTVWVRRDIAPWRSRTIARALAEFAAKTKGNANHDHNDRRH